ncbi:MAG: homocysteine S-methyltransferase family protein [Candidatus Firestonebacteria bacterium]
MKEHILGALQGKILVCDGAMGTMLQEKGLSLGECPEYWSITKPKTVTEIHKKYVEAGADIILANTFGANRVKLGKFNLENKIKEINIEGVKNARAAANKGVFVAGNIGPTGQLIEPLGFLKESDALGVFMEQAGYLAEGGADLIVIETMISIEETVMAAKAAKKTKLPVIAMMTFNLNNGDVRTVMGVDAQTMVKQLEDTGVDIVGSNCGHGIESMVEIVRAIKKETSRFVMAEPNAGLPVLKDGKIIYDGTPELMASYVGQLIEAGANIVGGCCGTTPAHIKLIKKEIERRNKK